MTSKLAERIKQYGIPTPPTHPIFDYVYVYRLPVETRTAGGLYIADVAVEYKPMGVLVSAGLLALDRLRSYGVELGDIVEFANYSGFEREVARDPENKGKHLIQLEAHEIRGSKDLGERIAAGEIEVVQGDDGKHQIKMKTKRKAA